MQDGRLDEVVVAVRRGAPRRSSYSEIIVHNTFPNTRQAQNPAIVSLAASDPAYDVKPVDLPATQTQMRHHSHAWFDDKSHYAIWSIVDSIEQKVDFFRPLAVRPWVPKVEFLTVLGQGFQIKKTASL